MPWYIAGLVLHVWRMVTENNVSCIILKACVWRLILKHCVWLVSGGRQTHWNLVSGWHVGGVWLASGRRLTPDFKKLRLVWLASGGGVWRALDAMFWNRTSGAMFQNQASDATYQNLPPDAIFCDQASDVYHEWFSVAWAYASQREIPPPPGIRWPIWRLWRTYHAG